MAFFLRVFALLVLVLGVIAFWTGYDIYPMADLGSAKARFELFNANQYNGKRKKAQYWYQKALLSGHPMALSSKAYSLAFNPNDRSVFTPSLEKECLEWSSK